MTIQNRIKALENKNKNDFIICFNFAKYDKRGQLVPLYSDKPIIENENALKTITFILIENGN